jgi:hypothetical protein
VLVDEDGYVRMTDTGSASRDSPAIARISARRYLAPSSSAALTSQTRRPVCVGAIRELLVRLPFSGQSGRPGQLPSALVPTSTRGSRGGHAGSRRILAIAHRRTRWRKPARGLSLDQRVRQPVRRRSRREASSIQPGNLAPAAVRAGFFGGSAAASGSGRGSRGRGGCGGGSLRCPHRFSRAARLG